MSITRTLPSDSRGTRFLITGNASAVSTDWEIHLEGYSDPFVIVTTSDGATTDDDKVLAATLNTLNIWLPPLHNVSIRTRQFVGGSYTDWTDSITFQTRGLGTSYEHYSQLNEGTITDPE